VSSAARNEAALYHRRGWCPIPVKERSKATSLLQLAPYLKRKATREELNAWAWPGVGIVTGPLSGVLVLDVDSPRAEEKLKEFGHPPTPMVRTAGGGLHLYFKHPGGDVRTGIRVAPELDVKAAGGYVVAPPSVGPNGRPYEWIISPDDAELANPPEWLMRLLERPKRNGAAPPVGKKLGPGERNRELTSIAGTMRRRGMEEPEILAALQAANEHRCDPPLEAEEVEKIAASVARYEPAAAGEGASAGDRAMSEHAASDVFEDIVQEEANARHSTRKKRSQADRLVDYALDSKAELFVDQVGAPHALLDGEAVPLNTRSYNWLRGLMWEAEEISTGGEGLKTASGMLAAFAAKSGKVRELHTRSAWHEGKVYYQLGPRRVVRVDRGGWEIEENPPVVFRSVPNLKPLPDPERGGTLDALENLINLKSERDRRMCKVHAATLPLPHIPRPILQTTGVMGSGKTTAGRVIKRLLDPTAPETVRVDPRDFLQKASHSYIVMLDNVNSVPEWAVDVLCRLVTGEADSKRSLYTDDEDFIYEMKRAVLLNGINAPTDRGDAQDRTLPVELQRIPDRERRSEEDLWQTFEGEHGRLLGAIFDTLAKTLRAKETLRLHRRPRLADWGEYAAAAYSVLGWGVERFLEDWGEVVKVQNQGTLDGSPVAQAILSFMESRNEWTGLASELHAKLEVEAEEMNINIKREKTWPKSPSWLWRRIREVLPLLMAMGVEAHNSGNSKSGSRITLTKVPAGDGPGGGSKNRDATTDATTENSAEESASKSSGSRGSNYGYSSATRTRTEEKEAEKPPSNSSEEATDTKVHRDATTATTARRDPVSADLGPGESATLEQLQLLRELVRDGMSEKFAREEVLGKGRGHGTNRAGTSPGDPEPWRRW